MLGSNQNRVIIDQVRVKRSAGKTVSPPNNHHQISNTLLIQWLPQMLMVIVSKISS